MIVNVRMLAFEDTNPDGSVRIRKVEIPDPAPDATLESVLESVFYIGQNDFQPQKCCSVSMADVVEFNDCLYVAASFGFKEISEGQYNELLALDQRDRHFWKLLRD